MTAVTVRLAQAVRIARSSTLGSCSGTVTISQYSLATSLNRAEQVDLLLVRAAHRAAVGLADDRDHRHVVELGVVQPVEQVDRAGSRGGRADPDPAGELGVADGLERGHLLVPGLDELRLVRRPGPRRRAGR